MSGLNSLSPLENVAYIATDEQVVKKETEKQEATQKLSPTGTLTHSNKVLESTVSREPPKTMEQVKNARESVDFAATYKSSKGADTVLKNQRDVSVMEKNDLEDLDGLFDIIARTPQSKENGYDRGNIVVNAADGLSKDEGEIEDTGDGIEVKTGGVVVPEPEEEDIFHTPLDDSLLPSDPLPLLADLPPPSDPLPPPANPLPPADLPPAPPSNPLPPPSPPLNLPAAPVNLPAAPVGAQQVQVQPVAADRAAALAQVQAWAVNLPADTTTQAVLKDMLQKLKDNGYSSIELQSALDVEKGTNKVQVEPYRLAAKPDKIFYRVKVTYTLINPNDNNFPKIEFSKTISTTATDPEVAIKVASKFKETVTGLALKSTGFLQGPLNDMKDEFKDAAMDSRSFQFGFAHTPAGKPTNLESIQVASGNTVVQYKVKSDSQNKFLYNQKDGSYQKADSKDTRNVLLPGQMLVDTEEEASLQKDGYSIKSNPDLYAELNATPELFDFHVKQVKDEIKKKEAEFAEVKATFVEERFLKWLKAHSTEKSKHILNDVVAYHAVKKDKEVTNIEKLSVDMKEFIETSQFLKDQRDSYPHEPVLAYVSGIAQRLQANPNLALNVADAEWLDKVLIYYAEKNPNTLDLTQSPLSNIETLKTIIEQKVQVLSEKEERLATLQNKISAEQASFNEKLSRLHKINGELKAQIQYLDQLKKGAEEGATSTDKQAKKTLDKEIKRLADRTNEYEKTITAIMNKVEKYGNKIDSVPSVLEASDE